MAVTFFISFRMNSQNWDPVLFHKFLTYFVYDPASIAAAKQLFKARALTTWKIYLRSAVRVWAQARIVNVPMFPLNGENLMKVLESVPRGRWTARHWTQVRAYLKIVAVLNNCELDPRVNMVVMGQARDNIVTMARREIRPVFSPTQMRNLFFKIKGLEKSHSQQRGLMALVFSYYAVGRGFDLTFLQGKHLDFNEDNIKINFHIRKNNKLALKRHVATLYSNYGYLCPVLTVLKAVAYMKLGPEDFLFHRDGCKSERMDPASLIASVKNLQKKAGSHPVLTLTDIRSSATTALVEGGVSSYVVMMWGNWETSQLKSYAKTSDKLRKSLQRHLEF